MVVKRENNVSESVCAANVKTMLEKFDEIKDELTNVKVSIAQLPSKLDGRYANKKTEQTVDRLMWLVVSSVIIAILALIFK